MRPKKKIKVRSLQADWKHPTEIRLGVGRIRELPEVCEKVGMRAPLLVTDPLVARLPFIKEILELNRNAGVATQLTDKNSLFVGRSIDDFALRVNGEGGP